MKPEEIEIGKTYEGLLRRGHRVFRTVEAITQHSGYATMARFAETVRSMRKEPREITLNSFADWAQREVTM
jgi:hypothetical protein